MTIGELFTRLVHGTLLSDVRFVRAIKGTVCATVTQGTFEVEMMRQQNGHEWRRIKVTVEVLDV
jgi:hypothetical protein